MADNTIDILLNARMNVSDAVGGVSEIQKAMRGLTLPKGISADLEKSFSKLTPLLKDYQKQLNKGFSSQKDIKNFNLLKEKIDSVFGDIKSQIKEVNGQEIRLKANTQEIDAVKNKIIKTQADLNNALQNVFKKNQSAASIETAFGKLENAIPKNWTRVTDMMSKASGSFKAGNYAEFNRQLQNTLNYIEKLSSTSQVDLAHKLGMDKAKTDVTDAQKYFNNFFNSLKTNIKEANNIESLRTKLSELGVELEGLNIKSLEDGPKAFEEWVQSIMNVDGALDQLHGSTQNTANSMVRMVDEVNELKSSTQYFFSLRNMINLLKRGIDEAVQSVKELDKAMTETAVVTDYKVSDLWGMLPEYTKIANQLGATTQGAYETMTLYYQQGLEQQQAFELGAETMKMARIAGLDYAETTDMMTAALRGFNMELNETSAKRVNDVYSELAAITASDTEELGTAMQRTASIAASAGASFEGTAAFLAQAIETTREPAENIGTAMKTIVARFQEMKKNPLEISEVDGEEVDYNKIDAALKTIGVDLKDTNGQFREFDQVMLDISAKWDTLSQSQQRYIATTAAGSRQQSRFIAMVSNYDRTMQLMEAANNSAGASDEQFGKTMDSLESKLNQLHNAWQQFTMGIANNDMIKMAVDGLTGFLNITNKIIDTLSLGSGALKSFLSIFAAFTGLKMVGRGANALIGGLGGLVDPKSSVKEGFKIGLFGQGKNAAQAKAITTPIVGSLSKISGQIAAIAKRQGIKDAGQKGNVAGVKETSKEEYANTKRLFSQLSGPDGFKISKASELFGALDAKHQLSMFNNNPGTKAAMQKASWNWFNAQGLSTELTKQGKQYISSIYKGMEQGQIPVNQGVRLIGRPDLWGEHFGTDAAKAISESFAHYTPSRESAEKGAWRTLNMKKASKQAREKFLSNSENKAQFEQLVNQNLDKGFQAQLIKNGKVTHGETKGIVSNMGRFANDIGAVADKFTQAGYGITTFGNALSQLGGPLSVVGSGIAAFGGAISTIGASISGATGIISLFTVGLTDATGAVIVAGSTIAAVAAPLAAAAGIFLLVRAHLKKVKEAGEEVTNTFNETNKTAEDNIAKLKSYQSEFATLSKGVDANGNNVSLDDSQYQRYLEIVDDIAAINPDIVEGYNAQGHAIINNNKALEETLKKQQQIKDEAYDTYTSEDSLQKLINARNINNDFKAINVKGESPSVYDGSGHGSEGRQKPVGLGRDVFNIVDQLRLNKDFDESSLQKYGIDSLDSLINGEEQAVKNFIKHRQQIQADLTNSGLELNESIIKGFDKLGEDAAAFDEAIKPVYDNLLANVSNSKVFESIAPEFRNALNIGLKDLASQDLDAPEMAKAANNMAMRFANLTNGSGKYKDALDIVEKAQDSFASSLDETQYHADVQPAIDDLIRLKEEALNEGSAYGDALAEYLENQIQRISNFTTEGGANLTEALNTATDEIAAAEGALDSFNEATKKDFSTAAEGMKGIFDKTTETFKDSYGTEIQKHAEGMGDATFWTGAEALLSEKEIERLTKEKDGYEAAEAVKKRLEGLEPMLREGQEGFDAFTNRVLENADAMDKLAKAGVEYDKESGLITNIPDDQWHNVAEALGISDDLLTSMLNKGRQFADISFMNVEDARKALAASDYTIQGNSSTAGNKNLYVKEDTLRMELSDAGYVRREQQDEQIKKLLAQGVKTIPASDSKELTQDKLKDMADDWGVKTLPDLIQTLNDTGDFTKDEIQDYAEKLDLIGDLDFDTVYSDLISALDNPELAKQTQELAELHGTTTAILDQMSGNTPEKQMQDAESLRKDTFGGDGIDTAVEAFGQGKKFGKNGTLEFMTPEEFATQSKYVSDLVDDYNKAAKQAQINADATTGATSKSYQQVADYYTKLAADTQREYERGLANYESNLQRQENAAKKTAEREESVRQAKIKKIPKNAKANEDNKTKTPGQTKTETIETITKKTNTEKNEITKQTTIVDGKITPGFKETEQATKSLENKDGMVVDIATKAELAGANAVIKSLGGINDKTVTVKTEGDASGAIAVKNAIANVTGKIVTIGTKLGSTDAIKTIDDKITALARRGSNIKIGTTQYKGQNNHIPYQSMPSFGSAARGRDGTVGPKNKGGLTLTGEKGFEIAWLPKENRSMILGAGGPQMLNLPSDAVIYTHEQSKQILKRKGIPAGSHANESASSSSYHKKYTGSTTGGNNNQTATSYVKGKKDSSSKKVTQEITKLINKTGYVVVWWDNQGHTVSKILRNAEKSQKSFDNLIKKATATVDDIEVTALKAIKDYQSSIKYNTQSLERADQELIAADKGTQAQQDANEAYKKANTKANRTRLKTLEKQKKTAKTDAERKKIQKKIDNNALTKAKKQRKTANKKAVALGTSAEISWEQTKKTKKNGKTKTSKVTKKVNINMSKYIMEDPNNPGTYILNEKAIQDVAKSSKKGGVSKAEAIRDAGNKIIDDKTKKKEEAEDNIEKAREAIAKMGQDIYDTFYGWENTLTRIYNITQKIEASEKRAANYKSGQELVEARLATGFMSLKAAQYEYGTLIAGSIASTVNEIQLGRQAIGAQRTQLEKAIDKGANEEFIINKLNKKLLDGGLAEEERALMEAEKQAAQDRLDAIKKAKEYANITTNSDGTINLDIQTDKLEQDRKAGLISETEFGEITKYLEDIQTENNNLLDEYQKQTSRITELYQSLSDLKQQRADYAKELFDQFVENRKKEIENVKTLSNAISDASKELLDEVKNRLDERRKREDNLQTETDISKKQQRLAALRADTSGGNRVAIAQLEKEIADAQQSYGRTLEDQLLDNLNKQNDIAQKQRERQISLQEKILEQNSLNGVYAEHINWLLDNVKDSEVMAEITSLLRAGYDYKGMPQIVKETVDTEIKKKTLDIATYQQQFDNLSIAIGKVTTSANTLESALASSATAVAKSQGLNIPTSALTKEEQAKVDRFNQLRDALIINPTSHNYADASYRIQQADAAWKALTPEEQATTQYNIRDTALTNMQNAQKKAEEEKRARQQYETYQQRLSSLKTKLHSTELIYNSTTNRLDRLPTLIRSASSDTARTALLNEQTSLQNKQKELEPKIESLKQDITTLESDISTLKTQYHFKTGGLANFTGPAWLDGTPSKPELVLNARDTQNFIALRDVLNKALGATTSVTNSYGGNATYEININVDKIEKDYDVDRVAERVKKIIVKDSGYRNVTQVRNFR